MNHTPKAYETGALQWFKNQCQKSGRFGALTRMNIGYTRASTQQQNLDRQIAALRAAGCEKIFRETGPSGALALRRLRPT